MCVHFCFLYLGVSGRDPEVLGLERGFFGDNGFLKWFLGDRGDLKKPDDLPGDAVDASFEFMSLSWSSSRSRRPWLERGDAHTEQVLSRRRKQVGQ